MTRFQTKINRLKIWPKGSSNLKHRITYWRMKLVISAKELSDKTISLADSSTTLACKTKYQYQPKTQQQGWTWTTRRYSRLTWAIRSSNRPVRSPNSATTTTCSSRAWVQWIPKTTPSLAWVGRWIRWIKWMQWTLGSVCNQRKRSAPVTWKSSRTSPTRMKSTAIPHRITMPTPIMRMHIHCKNKALCIHPTQE